MMCYIFASRRRSLEYVRLYVSAEDRPDSESVESHTGFCFAVLVDVLDNSLQWFYALSYDYIVLCILLS